MHDHSVTGANSSSAASPVIRQQAAAYEEQSQGTALGHPQSVSSPQSNISFVTRSNVAGDASSPPVFYGQHRLMSQTYRIDESRSGSILSERLVEHEIRVPKKIVKEEIIERVIVVPERRLVEEIVEEPQVVREKIIEVTRPTIVEKVVEVPEIEYVEKIVQVPQTIVQEKIVEKEKIIEKEVVVEVTHLVERERIIEVPEIEYRDVPYERFEYIDDIQEVVVEKKVPVPTYVNKPVPEYKNVEVPIHYERKIPVPLEAEVTYNYVLPTMRPRYTKTSYPVYLPRFIEVPVATELLNRDLVSITNKFLTQAGGLTTIAASLCEIEGLAATILEADILKQAAGKSLQDIVMKSWAQNQMSIVKAER